jgi:hypothetical protein
LVEKWIPPTRLETPKIGKKTEGILGVKIVDAQNSTKGGFEFHSKPRFTRFYYN